MVETQVLLQKVSILPQPKLETRKETSISPAISENREPLPKGKALYSLPPWLIFTMKIVFITFTKQATIMRRSTVLTLPLKLVFPGVIIRMPILSLESLEEGILGIPQAF
jgi:hypothetical protein